MALHIDVDWSGHGFELDVMRRKNGPGYRRTAWRNSAVRQGISGHCHFERWWWHGWDICLHWGQFNPAKPSQFYHPKEKKWLPKGT